MNIKDADQDFLLGCTINHMEVNAVPVRLNFGVPLASIHVATVLHVASPHQIWATTRVAFNADVYPQSSRNFIGHSLLSNEKLRKFIVDSSEMVHHLSSERVIGALKIPKADSGGKYEPRKCEVRLFEESRFRDVLPIVQQPKEPGMILG